MTRSNHYRVIVVGLGAMGSATLRHLAARGVRVLGIDQFSPPHAFGSSHGESRIIREVYFEDPLYVPLVQRAWGLWEQLARDSGRSELIRRTGGLMFGDESGSLITGARRSAAMHHLLLEDVDANGLRQRFPQFPVPAGFTVLHDTRAGILDPEACVAAHLECAARDGAVIHTNEQVLDWKPLHEGIEILSSHGTYSADQVVLSAGSWIRELVQPLSDMFTIERQAMVWFEPPGDAPQWSVGRFPIWLTEFNDGQFIYGVPMGERGLKAAVHYQGEAVQDVRTMRRTFDASDLERIRHAVARLFPWARTAPVRDVAICTYTNTRDLHFLIDFLPQDSRVLLCSPCSGHGFKFASAIGELQAQLLLDGRCDADIAPFRIGGRNRPAAQPLA